MNSMELTDNRADIYPLSSLYRINILHSDWNSFLMELTLLPRAPGWQRQPPVLLGLILDCISTLSQPIARDGLALLDYEVLLRCPQLPDRFKVAVNIEHPHSDYALLHCSLAAADDHHQPSLAEIHGTLSRFRSELSCQFA